MKKLLIVDDSATVMDTGESLEIDVLGECVNGVSGVLVSEAESAAA